MKKCATQSSRQRLFGTDRLQVFWRLDGTAPTSLRKSTRLHALQFSCKLEQIERKVIWPFDSTHPAQVFWRLDGNVCSLRKSTRLDSTLCIAVQLLQSWNRSSASVLELVGNTRGWGSRLTLLVVLQFKPEPIERKLFGLDGTAKGSGS